MKTGGLKKLDRQVLALYFFEHFTFLGTDSMRHLFNGRYFFFYCYFSKGLPGAR
jgi:hypothetical protein